ncbi:MAG: CDP-alcohol phosphatidyltransferase family protein [Propionibacteriaceae bacterium]|nr:CDP-alcohol phosphatidyltransferase family protein [Propionibacteriaceae bacterium]
MANAITVGRVIAGMIVIYLIFVAGPTVVEWCALAIIVVIFLDAVDGWVARARHETGQFGAIFDIVGDRIVENALWIAFACLGMIPAWVPLLVMARGFLVDGLRSAGYSEGMTPFGEHNMMRSKVTTWLTAGRFMRGLFGTAKVLAFAFLAGLRAYELPGGHDTVVGWAYQWVAVRGFGWFLVWAAVVLTVVRGVPVVIDAMAYLRERDARERASV